MQYTVIVMIRSGTNPPVEIPWYRGDNLAVAIGTAAQAAAQDVADTAMPESIRTHLVSVRIDYLPEVSGNAASTSSDKIILRTAYNLLGDGQGNEWEGNPEYTRAVFEMVADTVGLGLNVSDHADEIEALIRSSREHERPASASTCTYCGAVLVNEDCPNYGDGPIHQPVVPSQEG